MISELSTSHIRFSAKAQCAALLTDQQGGYFVTGLASRYRGLFHGSSQGPIKIIDQLAIAAEIRKRKRDPSSITECYDQGEVRICYHPLHPILCIMNDTSLPIETHFDVRHTYANPEWNHAYAITTQTQEGNTNVILHYANSSLPLPTQKGDIWIAIFGPSLSVDKPDRWESATYEFDQQRGSYPSQRSCYNALRINGRNFFIAVHESREKLEELIVRLQKSGDFMMPSSMMFNPRNQMPNGDYGGIFSALLEICGTALHSFYCGSKDRGLLAGIPWFFQRWLRDEAISLGGLLAEDRLDETAHLLDSWLQYFGEHHCLPNMLPITSSKTSDGPAWLAYRLAGLLSRIQQEKRYAAVGGEAAFGHLLNQLEQVVLHYQAARDQRGFFQSLSGESWMDAPIDGDTRDGALIEIEALWCAVFSELHALTKDQRYKVLELELHTLMLSHFYNGTWLADRQNDFTIRPNVFLAYYAYPSLLYQSQWKRCFTHILPRLWARWGGLTTIDVHHPLFRANSSGEDKASYHRGDSWFWINAYAALGLLRADPHHFRAEIAALCAGCIAHHIAGPVIGFGPETRGAQDTQCLGSPAQTWSSGTLLELLHALGPHYPYLSLLKDKGINVDFH